MDYKTDYVKNGGELLEKYRKQLDYYELALERLTGKRVKEKVIYSFCLRCEVPVEKRQEPEKRQERENTERKEAEE